MNRKEMCERIILTPQEKRLLGRIRRSKNGLKCSASEAAALLEYDLIQSQRENVDWFGVPVPTGRYVLSDFYAVYAAYCRRELLDYIADKWIDILASVISLLSLVISIAALWQSALPPA